MTKDIDQKTGLPKTRAEAKISGHKYYFTGVGCIRGHISKRFTSNGSCTDCAKDDTREAARARRVADRDSVNSYNRQWRANNPDKVKGWKADWQKNNPEKTRAARLRFLESRPEYELERSRRRTANATAEDVQKKSASMAKWRKNNPDRNKEIQKRSNRKLLSTPKGKLGSLIRNGINAEIKKGSKSGRKTFELLDYTLDELKDHLEKQFQPGMDWNNHGTGEGKWHIDHIIPLAAHNYETPDDIDFKKAWALANLQPLWANANMSKGAKIDKPFQPALALSIS